MIRSLLIFIFFPIFSFGQLCDSLLIESIVNPGPYSISSIDENSGVRNGPDYSGSTIFFPTNLSLNMLPSIVLVPGFMNSELTIQNWGDFFASHGIVTMTIGTNLLTDSHIKRRDALLDAIISLKNENQRILSPLFGKIDTTSIAVGGFSKGGGGAQLVPKLNPNISAILSLYPWLDNPTSSDLNHSVPTMIISGQLDAFAPPGIHANVHYNLLPNTTKKLKYEIAFASHDAISGPNAGFGDVGVRALSWLKTFLLKDSCYCPIAVLEPSTSSSFITNLECDIISDQLEFYSDAKVNEVRDMFGRITELQINMPLIFFFNDGRIEKKIILK